jgi:hypothetical protein
MGKDPEPRNQTKNHTRGVVRERLCTSSAGDFRKIAPEDTCEGQGLLLINDTIQCRTAARLVALADTSLQSAVSGGDVPVGCYIKNGVELFMGKRPEPRHPICSTRSGKFKRIYTGTCEEGGLRPVLNRSHCEAAATSLGLNDTSASLTSNADVPHGCYIKPATAGATGPTLWMGIYEPAQRRIQVTRVGSSEGNMTREPICTTPTMATFVKIPDGHTCDEEGLVPIMQTSVCEHASRNLRLTDNEATPTNNTGVPEGCYYLKGEELWLGTRPPAQQQPLCTNDGGTSFHMVPDRTCKDYGFVPITRAEDCLLAAHGLGVAATDSVSFTSDPRLSRGCYIRNGDEIWIKREMRDVRELGLRGPVWPNTPESGGQNSSRDQICSNQPDPVRRRVLEGLSGGKGAASRVRAWVRFSGISCLHSIASHTLVSHQYNMPSEEACRESCEQESRCVGVQTWLVANESVPCWHLHGVEVSACQSDDSFSLWMQDA